MRKFFSALFITIVITGNAFASEIRQAPYAYSYEFADSLAGPAFVICNNCPARKALVRAPKPIPIAIMVRVPQRAAPGQLWPEPVNSATARPRPASPIPAKPITVKPAELTVHFAFDSYTLRPSTKARLMKAPSMFKGPVSVTGYTDDIGTSVYNMELSRKRADAVAAFLRRIGVALATVTGKGECCPVSKTKKLNRRVEIKGVSN